MVLECSGVRMSGNLDKSIDVYIPEHGLCPSCIEEILSFLRKQGLLTGTITIKEEENYDDRS